MINIQKIKDDAFSKAISELKEEMADDPDAIKRLDSYTTSQSEEEKKPHQSDAADGNNSLIKAE